jgi:hypothetical protein
MTRYFGLSCLCLLFDDDDDETEGAKKGIFFPFPMTRESRARSYDDPT